MKMGRLLVVVLLLLSVFVGSCSHRILTAEERRLAAEDMLHIGNRWINHAGLGYYDNTARYYDALTVRFTAADSHERKYLTMTY